jgi:peptidoglycan/xylan/chitin deacetylase (PgdA/CDA1 family)
VIYLKKIPKFLEKLFPGITWRGETYASKVYLTFDDGPHPESTPYLLDILDTYEVKATFFCLGSNVKKYPELFNQIREKGHAVGNHGFDHISGWVTPIKRYIDNVDQAAEYIPSKLFRPPFGRISLRQYWYLKKRYRIIMWSLMPGDFDKRSDDEDLVLKINKLLRKGDILVLHDRPENMDKTLKLVSSMIKQKDLSFDII